MRKVFKIEVDSKLDSLAIIRSFIKDSLNYENFNQDIIYDLELCIDEICSNIMKYGYKEKNGKILLKIIVDNDKVKAVIIDKAGPFNILKYNPPDREELLKSEIKGKIGIRTIKAICDKLDYKRLKNKNKIEIIKYKN
jgi:anti-sigma regulatory factor (Ser/Thr protein kinase)